MKLFLIVLPFVCIIKSVVACDVCGCSMSGFSMGILPNQNSQFIGLRYNYSAFSSSIDHTSTSGGNESSHDRYQRFDLMGRIKLSPKFKLNLVLPFLYNSVNGTTEDATVKGIGDPNILLYYQPFKDHKKWKSPSLYIGGGIKLPLGKFKQEDNGNLINPNFQLGTGSVDFIATSNYTYRKNKMGFYLEASYKINTKNKFDYRFGNQFNAASNLFYLLEKKKMATLFYLGTYFETASSNLENRLKVYNTGGFGLYANAGLQFFVKRFRLGFLYQYPIVQKFRTDNLTEISAKPRFTFDLIFSLGKK